MIVVEGLADLVKSFDIGEFSGLNIKEKCYMEILRFVDNTLLVGDGNWKHVWALKPVLRGFTMV